MIHPETLNVCRNQVPESHEDAMTLRLLARFNSADAEAQGIARDWAPLLDQNRTRTVSLGN